MPVQIDEGELARLREQSAILEALMAAGVDNWEGYEDALAGVKAESPADQAAEEAAPADAYELD